MTVTRALTLLLFITSFSISVRAQTIDDGVMMRKGVLFAGDLYTHDSWDHYWEGALKRNNGNIGRLTTRTNSWFGNYGLSNRLNLIGVLPYVWTRASQGVLHGMHGVQDITLAAKYSLLERPTPKVGALRAIAVVSAALPLTDYTPDFYPLSIGSASRRISGRFTVNLQSDPGWFVNGSTGYTWRGAVTLDRPYYFTDGQLFMTDEVAMPRVVDYVLSGGYLKRGLMVTGAFAQQRTQGGGDIRRQDMPFVSNRMNFSRVSGMVMYPIPTLRDLAFQFSYAHTIDGRNVGQATTITTGLLYRFHFFGRPSE
jgi:Putative MetA-pathway of phenol degradation